MIISNPTAGPALIGPAKAEGEIGLTCAEDLSDGTLQQLLTTEPIVVVAEAMDAVLAGEIGLLLTHLRKTEVVVAEICGKVGLVVAGKERGGSGYIAPLGETRAPPLIVFRNRVILGEVKGNKLSFHIG